MSDPEKPLSSNERRYVAAVALGLGGFVSVVFLVFFLSSGAFVGTADKYPADPAGWEVVKYGGPGGTTRRPANEFDMWWGRYGPAVFGAAYAVLTILAAVTLVQAIRRRRTVLTRLVLRAMERRV